MTYTQIYIDNIPIDLSTEDISIPLTYALVDIKNLNNRASSKSKTIRVPRTEVNEKVFGLPFDINATNQFDKYGKHDISIYESSELIFQGLCQLIQANRDEIELFCYKDLAKFKGISGTKTLQDLNLSDLQHVYDTTIFDTWNGIYPTYVEPDYIYPVIDYGQFYARTLPGDGETPIINVVDLYPAVYLRRLIKQICKDNGYTLVTSFFDDPQMNNIIIPFTNEQFVHSLIGGIVEFGFIGYGSEQIVLDSTTGTENVKIEVEEYDELNQWDNSTYEFTAANAAVHAYTLDLVIQITNNTVQIPLYVLVEYWDGLTWTEIDRVQVEAPTFPTSLIQLRGSQPLLIGDKLRFVFEKNDSASDITSTAVTCYIDPSQQGEIQEGEVVQLEPNLPPIKQVDLFKWCYQMFNWVVEINDDIGVIYIDTDQQYYNLGETKDMSDKITLKPLPEIKYDDPAFARKYDFRYKHEVNDYFLRVLDGQSDSATGVLFGDGNLYLTEFGDATLIGEVGFSPTAIAQSFQGGTDYMEVPTIINTSISGLITPTTSTKTTPRILIYAGPTSVSTLTGGAQSSIQTQVGDLSEIAFAWFQKRLYNDGVLDLLDMNLSYQINLRPGDYTTGNLIDRFYRNTIQNLSVSAQVDAWFNLNASDVSNIDFSVLWYIEYFNAYFRVNKIVDYLPGKNLPTKVELIKVGVFSGASEDYEPFDT